MVACTVEWCVNSACTHVYPLNPPLLLPLGPMGLSCRRSCLNCPLHMGYEPSWWAPTILECFFFADFLLHSSAAQSYRRVTRSSTSTGSTPVNAQLRRSSQQPEKMAASLLAHPPLAQLAELNLSAMPKAVLYSLGTDSSLLRELPLLWGVWISWWRSSQLAGRRYLHLCITASHHTHTLTHTLTHMYMHAHTHIYTHTHTHTLIHTHTHTHIQYTHIQNVVLERLKKHGEVSICSVYPRRVQ